MTKGIVNLQGKQYQTVALRMSEFRKAFKPGDGWAVVTIIHAINQQSVLFRAEIRDPKGVVVATGHSSGSLKGGKALEKTETVAIGRALAAMGLGGEYGYATADEIAVWEADKTPAKPPEVAPPGEGHHASWEGNRKAFCAACGKVAPGSNYAKVKEYAVFNGQGKPSEWTTEKRREFYGRINTGNKADDFRRFLEG